MCAKIPPTHTKARCRPLASLAVPMLRDGEPIGTIFVGRAESGLFSAKQVELLQTFATHAVIAIENVRLFTALNARNRDLTEALDQQTVLRKDMTCSCSIGRRQRSRSTWWTCATS